MIDSARITCFALGLSLLFTGIAQAERTESGGVRVPLFARQTNRMCSACHLTAHYPELTEMGRTFKLNGYRLSKIDSLLGDIEENTAGGRSELLLNLANSLGFMLQSSYTATKTAPPGTQNGTVLVPDQLSLFLGGRVTPKTGAFVQLTYSGTDGSFGIDNIDLRFVDSARIFSKSAIVGITLNNNPTVQDIWNTTPAWGFPWASSSVAPTPAATTIIDGTLAQQAAGLTVNTMWNKRVYGEVGVYRTLAIGHGGPLDTTSSRISGVAPYWRVALPFPHGNTYFMLGTYGMSAGVYPPDVTGLTNRFTDLAVDGMVQRKLGTRALAFHGTWIHETQHWDAGGAGSATNDLNTFRLDAQLHFGHTFTFILSPFSTTGSSDSVLYAPGAVSGSETGSPNSSGLIGEVDANPWDNVRLQFEYVAYNKFNGSSQNYDGAGRNASDNNTLFVIMWLVF